MRAWIAGIALLGVLLGFAGCRTAEYQGPSPSARSLKGGPRNVGDFYIGMDFRWSVDRAEDYYRPPVGEPVATASAAEPE